MNDDQHPLIVGINAIFEGDGSHLRQQFIYAGLLLTIFERFKKYVIDHVDGFFSTYVEIKEGDIRYTRGEKFKKLIKERGAGQPGQHNNKDFRAALLFFHQMGALDKDDFDEIERLYNLRNKIGHELLRIVAFDGSPIMLVDILFTFGVYVNIVRWWVKEIEIPTNLDLTEDEYKNINWDEVDSAESILLREILNKSLSEDPQWHEYQKEIEKLKQNRDI